MLVERRPDDVLTTPIRQTPKWLVELRKWEREGCQIRNLFAGYIAEAARLLTSLTKLTEGAASGSVLRQHVTDVEKLLAAIERMLSEHASVVGEVHDALVCAALEKRRARRVAAMAEQSVRPTIGATQLELDSLVAICARDQTTFAAIAVETDRRDPKFERYLSARMKESIMRVLELTAADPALIIHDAGVAAWADRVRALDQKQETSK